MELHKLRPFLMIVGLLLLVAAIGIMLKQTFSRGVPPMVSPVQVAPAQPFALTSPALTDTKTFPESYICTESATNPPLTIENAPKDTKEFVVILQDLDGETDKVTHWVIWNISEKTPTILENTIPTGAVVGTNDFGKTALNTPCNSDESKPHRFVYDLYAIDEPLELDTTSTKDRVIAAMNGHVIDKAQLFFTVAAKKNSSTVNDGATQ